MVYNLICTCIFEHKSVINQRYRNIEIIVILSLEKKQLVANLFIYIYACFIANSSFRQTKIAPINKQLQLTTVLSLYW